MCYYQNYWWIKTCKTFYWFLNLWWNNSVLFDKMLLKSRVVHKDDETRSASIYQEPVNKTVGILSVIGLLIYRMPYAWNIERILRNYTYIFTLKDSKNYSIISWGFCFTTYLHSFEREREREIAMVYSWLPQD